MKTLIGLAGALTLALAPIAVEAKPKHGKGRHEIRIERSILGQLARTLPQVTRGARGCPPGLADRSPGCVPPGLARSGAGAALGAVVIGNVLGQAPLPPEDRYIRIQSAPVLAPQSVGIRPVARGAVLPAGNASSAMPGQDRGGVIVRNSSAGPTAATSQSTAPNFVPARDSYARVNGDSHEILEVFDAAQTTGATGY